MGDYLDGINCMLQALSAASGNEKCWFLFPIVSEKTCLQLWSHSCSVWPLSKILKLPRYQRVVQIRPMKLTVWPWEIIRFSEKSSVVFQLYLAGSIQFHLGRWETTDILTNTKHSTSTNKKMEYEHYFVRSSRVMSGDFNRWKRPGKVETRGL